MINFLDIYIKTRNKTQAKIDALLDTFTEDQLLAVYRYERKLNINLNK